MGISTKTCKDKNCGNELLSGADFCDRCGKPATLTGMYKKNQRILPVIIVFLAIIAIIFSGLWLREGQLMENSDNKLSNLTQKYGASISMRDGDEAFFDNDYKNAIKYYNESTRLDPENQEAWYKRGISQYHQAVIEKFANKKDDKARTYANEAIESYTVASRKNSFDDKFNKFLYKLESDAYVILGNNTGKNNSENLAFWNT